MGKYCKDQCSPNTLSNPPEKYTNLQTVLSTPSPYQPILIEHGPEIYFFSSKWTAKEDSPQESKTGPPVKLEPKIHIYYIWCIYHLHHIYYIYITYITYIIYHIYITLMNILNISDRFHVCVQNLSLQIFQNGRIKNGMVGPQAESLSTLLQRSNTFLDSPQINCTVVLILQILAWTDNDNMKTLSPLLPSIYIHSASCRCVPLHSCLFVEERKWCQQYGASWKSSLVKTRKPPAVGPSNLRA